MNRFLAAVRFLTRFPVPGKWGTGESAFARCASCFPLVGALLGAAAAALAWSLLSLGVSPMLVGAVVVVLLPAFSGGLHADGLADTADGLLSSKPRDRALEIMRDSRVGAMGVLALISLFLMKFAALASMNQEALWRTALFMPFAGRCALVVQIALLPSARPGGLGTLFCRNRPYVTAAGVVVALPLAGWFLAGIAGAVTGGIGLAVTLGLGAYFCGKLGGATGDTFGASCEIVEMTTALSMAMWPRNMLA